ncbi:hypothetical protein C7R54_12510 [Achromobacter aloeverae]|uniref:Dystroglycan-type cadherin-like domain-containing protein n=2 Tax=Achromobacter aloeverae TaxID=1750518 RepID=A0A4V1MS75_9BURK|nr:hypothetical protein C7R54_12510 [Achromobacter aloeverae]
MFDGAAVATAAHGADAKADAAHAAALAAEAAAAASVHQVRDADASTNNGRKEVAFVDTSVADYRTLEAGVRAGVAIVEYDGSKDGLAQIAAWAQNNSGYDAIHILSHGSEGTLNLGADILNDATLSSATVQAELADIGHALNAGGDILLYGCDVAAGSDGQQFLDDLARITGADVAASTNATGDAELGGDWTLEAHAGKIDAQALGIADYHGLLTVVTLTDADADYSSMTVSKTVDGATVTFTGGTGFGGMGMDTSYGSEGLYAYEGTAGGNDIKLTISIQPGYEFDLKSFNTGVTSGSLAISLTYANGNTASFTINSLSDAWQTLSSFSTSLDHVTQVVLSSSDFGLFQNFDIANVKLIPAIPTVTDGHVAITSSGTGLGGAYKIGDIVTAVWDNTAVGDNNAEVTTVTMDFSQFGGPAAVLATNTGGVWTASYTITAAALDAVNRHVAVSASNDAGTTTRADSTNLTVDAAAPTVTDANISISGATGSGGAFKIGDTVTVTWNNTAGGDNNSDTLSGVTVNFTQFGGGAAVAATNSGGTWIATYTITSGAIQATNRNVSVTVTDNAGNSRTTADTTNATVDNIAPSVTFGSLSFTPDTGASAHDFITRIAATDVTATLGSALAPGDVVYGSLDNGASWTNLTSKVSGTQLVWDVTLAQSGTLLLKVADAAGNEGATFSQAYVLDMVAPATPSTPVMDSASDTGYSPSDGLTSNTTPTFRGTAETGSTVTLYDSDGITVLGSTTAAGGVWSITTTTLAQGTHSITAKATDVAGNVSAASSANSITVDTAAPANVTLSSSTVLASAANAGANIATLSSSDGLPVTYSLAAGNGANDADNVRFNIAGSTLQVVGASLSVGSYKVYVAATDAAGNVSQQAFTITVTDPPPTVASIVRAGGAGQAVTASTSSLSYTVTFSEAVAGVDASDFALSTTGTAAGRIVSVSGSGTTYTIFVDSLSGDGTLRLDLNGSGTGIRNGGGVDIAAGYSGGQTYTLDHTAPSVTISSSASSLKAGEQATITFTFSEDPGTTFDINDVRVNGGTLGFLSGTGYVRTTIFTPTRDMNGGTASIGIVAGAYTDAAGNPGNSSNLSIAFDTAAPTTTVSSIAFSDDTGSSATDFITNASGQVVSGTLSANLQSGEVVMVSLDGGQTWTGATAAVGSNTWSIMATLTGSGVLRARVQDLAGNASAETVQSYVLDTTAPVVDSVAVPANGLHTFNDNLDFTVNFSEAVTVDASGGTPRIALTIGSTTVYAYYQSGSGTSDLVFRYTVANGDLDLDGITVGALSTNGGSIKDLAGNSAISTLNGIGTTAGVTVDGGVPQITSVTSGTPNGLYKAGDSVTIVLTFSEAVTVSPVGAGPTLALNNGGVATYAGGSGTDTLTFTYTIGAGQDVADLDYSGVGALSLHGSTIEGTSGAHANAVLSLPFPGAAGSLGANKDIAIDATAPSVAFGDLALSADTGASGSDFITSAAGQTITATLNHALDSGDRVYGSLDNGATWVDITGKVSGTSLAWDGVTLAGSGTIVLRVVDAAGNEGAPQSQAYVLDMTPPAAPTVDPVQSSSLTPVLSGDATLAAGDVLTVTVGGASYDVIPAGGHWSLDLASAIPASGSIALTAGASYNVTAIITDLAGNRGSASGVLSVIAPPPSQGTEPPPPAEPSPPAETPPSEPPPAPPTAIAPPPPLPRPPAPIFAGVEPLPHDGPSASIRTMADAGRPTAPPPDAAGASPALDASVQSVLVAGNLNALVYSQPPVDRLTSLIEAMRDQGRAEPGAMTHGDGFHVVIVPASPGFQGLMLYQGIAARSVLLSGRSEFDIPADAFAHTDPNATVRLSAGLSDGRPLPAWLRFDGRLGRFVVQAPSGMTGDIAIRVIARDGAGKEAATVFHLRLGAAQSQVDFHGAADAGSRSDALADGLAHATSGEGQRGQAGQAGRLALSEQLQQAARQRSGAGALERLAHLARALHGPNNGPNT